MSDNSDGKSGLNVGLGAGAETLEPAPANSLPGWDECALRVHNSDFIARRIAEGGYGADPDSKLATQLHGFIYEYDDADPYRSAWFLHRLELVLQEARGEAPNAGINGKCPTRSNDEH